MRVDLENIRTVIEQKSKVGNYSEDDFQKITLSFMNKEKAFGTAREDAEEDDPGDLQERLNQIRQQTAKAIREQESEGKEAEIIHISQRSVYKPPYPVERHHRESGDIVVQQIGHGASDRNQIVKTKPRLKRAVYTIQEDDDDEEDLRTAGL